MFEPVEDFDLALVTAGWTLDYASLVDDPACPARDYLLSVLYHMADHAAETGYAGTSEAQARALVDRADSCTHPDVKLWQQYARARMDDPGAAVTRG